MPWIDQYTGQSYQFSTESFHGSRGVARVKTYGDVLREYEFHPGTKSTDAKGKPSGRQTIGLLQRRHIRVGQIIYIGKESNKLEEIELGIVHSAQMGRPEMRRHFRLILDICNLLNGVLGSHTATVNVRNEVTVGITG
jgi:hypothetical protein